MCRWSPSRSMRVFVDMDGVLVNFHKHACPLFSIEYPKQSVLGWDWLYNLCGIPIEEWLGRMDDTPGFWENLEPYPWTTDLIQFLDSGYPNWAVLTMATQDPRSWAGKAAWVKRYLPVRGMYRLIMSHGSKGRFAQPGDVLIDDSYNQCAAWREAGGKAFHWVEYTDDFTERANEQLVLVKKFIEDCAREQEHR